MREQIMPVIKATQDKRWLTIGDGRYGTDAHYLLSQGIRHVHASDMVDTLLKLGAEKGFINEYSIQNAEHLTFSDEQFDYVYCKEAYHHFPRPYIAVYEMLRVCREAVILTEPNDLLAPRSPIQAVGIALWEGLKKLLGRHVDYHVFEDVGNYVYSLSELEVKKLMLGVGLRYCAFKRLNDRYIPGAELAPMSGGTKEQQKIKKDIERGILRDDLLCKLGLKKPLLITAVMFKQKPDDALWLALGNAGFECVVLPENPYKTWVGH
jgi:SAM-dependent methyltransferase